MKPYFGPDIAFIVRMATHPFKFTITLFLPLSLLATLTLFGCGLDNPIGQVKNPMGPLDSSQVTGGTKNVLINEENESDLNNQSAPQMEVELPYTIAGNEKLVEHIRTEINDKSDAEVSKAIRNVTVDTQLPIIKVQIQFDPLLKIPGDVLEFSAQLVPKNGTYKGENVESVTKLPQSHPFQYKLDLTCYDDCRILDIRLKKYDVKAPESSNGTPTQSGIIYRKSKPKLALQQGGSEDAKSPIAISELKNTLDASAELVTVTVVTGGPSFADLSTANGFHAKVDLLDTSSTAVPLGKVQLDNKSKAMMDFSIIGMEPSTGSFVMGTDIGGGASIVVENEPLPVLDIPKSKKVKKYTDEKMPASGEKAGAKPKPESTKPKVAIFNEDNIDPNSQAKKIIKNFTDYETDVYIKAFINAWLGKGNKPFMCLKKVYNKKTKKTESVDVGLKPSLKRIQNFIENVQPLTDSIEKITSIVDVPPDIAYLLLFESQYFQDGEYNSMILSTVDHDSVGPWQIRDRTADHIINLSGINFVKYNINANRVVNPKDDRTYFLNSTLMAAYYLKYLFSENTHDPAVAILAYNAGQGGAQSAMGSKYKISLGQIIRFRVQSGEYCKPITYALSFLSARAIGQNLSKYGLDNIPPTQSKKYLPRLKNPNSQLPLDL